MAKARKTPAIDDKRLKAVPLLIKAGYINTFASIFDYIPRTVIADHLKLNHNKMKEYVEVPGTMPTEKLEQLAAFLKVDLVVLKKLTRKKAK